MSPFLSRSKRAGPFLVWKVRVFTVGAALALGGMYLEARWLTGLAIGILAVGMVLLMLPRGDDGGAREADEAGPGIDAGDPPGAPPG